MDSPHTTRRWRPSLALILALGLAACGEPEQPPDTGAAGPDEAAAEPAREEVTIPGAERSPLIAGMQGRRFTGDLPGMRERGVVRALVTYSRTDFFLDHGTIRGVQADFLRAYEAFLNRGVDRAEDKVRVRFVPVPFARLLPALEAGVGDVAAAFLTVTPERRQRVAFSDDGNFRVSEVVVRHVDAAPVAALADLSGQPVQVLKGSSYAEHLAARNRELEAAGRAPIRVREAASHLLSEDLLELVNAGVFPYTVVDDYKARLWARVLPDIRVHEEVVVAADNPVGWAVRQGSPRLRASIDAFIEERAGLGSLLGNMLFKRYFENTRWVDDPTRGAARDRLERYLPLFREYGERYGFDPLLLAALAYQESGLDPSRESHRGAVGLMQLLPSTAADPNVGIPDIAAVEANVHAGAKYLAFLRERYFTAPDIRTVDRNALTLAAYNAGPRRVREMRELAGEMGLDPKRWFGQVEVAAGRIVGRETVDYVANIHKYYLAYRAGRELATRREAAREAH